MHKLTSFRRPLNWWFSRTMLLFFLLALMTMLTLRCSSQPPSFEIKSPEEKTFDAVNSFTPYPIFRVSDYIKKLGPGSSMELEITSDQRRYVSEAEFTHDGWVAVQGYTDYYNEAYILFKIEQGKESKTYKIKIMFHRDSDHNFSQTQSDP
ncbi:MAG: hypothetical protein ACPGO5_00505 [Patescibacteria group bacterium]